MLKRFPQALPLLIVVLLVALAALASWRIVDALHLPLGSRDYDVLGWEVRHLPGKWLYRFGRLWQGELSREEKDRRIEDYLALQAEVAALEGELGRQRASGDPGSAGSEESLRLLAEKREERDRLENAVEAILEERISEVASGLGLKTSLPFFPGARWLFPPVDLEFDSPPYVLVVSPRDRIYLESARLLRSDLALEETLRLEDEEERASKNVSALVVRTGGVATYPSVIPPGDSYRKTLEVAAHEWVHHYLFFHPLGARYFQSETLRTINETVADIAGQEMAALVGRRYPLPSLEEPPPGESEGEETLLEEELHRLRIDVDRLLAAGRVEEAEALMEERRQYLAERGYFIRRINQAYFAFYGLYGTTAASSSPLGPKMEELRRRSPSLGDFIRAVSQVTSEDDLDRLLSPIGEGAIRP